MEQEISRLVLTKSSADAIKSLYGHLSKLDHTNYPDCPNKEWYYFGDPIVGHGSITKLGRSDYKSNHWRGGGIWIHPDFRSKRIGITYISSLLRFMLSRMPGPTKYIYGRSWIGKPLTNHYIKMGWIPGKEYKGGFLDIKKVIRVIDNVVYEIRDDILVESPGLVEPGDLSLPFPGIRLCSL